MKVHSGQSKRLLVLSALVLPCTFFISGCGFIAGLFGIGFETYYSPEQRDVFRSNVQLGLNNFGTDVPPPTPDEVKELVESGVTICELLRQRPRDEVKEELVREILSGTPAGPTALAERFAEVFITASTAQGSLCPELR